MKKVLLVLMAVVSMSIAKDARADYVASMECDPGVNGGTYLHFNTGYTFSKPANVVRGVLALLAEPVIIALWKSEINSNTLSFDESLITFDIDAITGGCAFLEITSG